MHVNANASVNAQHLLSEKGLRSNSSASTWHIFGREQFVGLRFSVSFARICERAQCVNHFCNGCDCGSLITTLDVACRDNGGLVGTQAGHFLLKCATISMLDWLGERRQ